MTVRELQDYFLKKGPGFQGEEAWVAATPDVPKTGAKMVVHEETGDFIELDEGFPLELSSHPD